MSFSMVVELEGGGTVTLDSVVSYTVEEMEPSPDEVPEEGEEERGEEEREDEVDLSSEKAIPLEEVE